MEPVFPNVKSPPVEHTREGPIVNPHGPYWAMQAAPTGLGSPLLGCSTHLSLYMPMPVLNTNPTFLSPHGSLKKNLPGLTKIKGSHHRQDHVQVHSLHPDPC